jgi:hypothetical protein
MFVFLEMSAFSDTTFLYISSARQWFGHGNNKTLLILSIVNWTGEHGGWEDLVPQVSIFKEASMFMSVYEYMHSEERCIFN